MSEPPGFLEDYANALGHVVISYNAMEQAITDLAALLWRDQDQDQVVRLFGRRSLDERLGLIASKLNEPNTRQAHSADWIDRLDRLLAGCRPLAIDRHDAVHKAVMTIKPGGDVAYDDGVNDWSLVEDLIALSDAIDRQTEALASEIHMSGPKRLDSAG